ncbi:MAG: hypothetical protein H6R40_884 [Gemmatimonadetes bacterium]|nr:hypothetical protein [Gemmatimonadota bacterium]
MDKQMMALMIPILALAIPLVAVIATSLIKLQRVRNEGLNPGPDPALLAEVDELRHELGQVRAELGEVQERLDFTERLLTSGERKPPAGS